MKDEYYIAEGEAARGPLTLAQLRSMWRRGRLTKDSLFFQTGCEEWMPLATISADLDAEQLPEVSAYAATRHIAVRTQEEEEGPPAFGIAVVTFLIPIIGVIVGIVWLCRREESYRGWGGMLVFVGLLLTIVYGVIIANL